MAAVGHAKCLNDKCGQQVVVTASKGGGRNWTCKICELSAYTKPGTDAQRDLDARIVKLKADPPPPEPPKPGKEKETPPPAKPAAKYPGYG